MADKWESYERRCREADNNGGKGAEQVMNDEPGKKTARGLILDELGIERACCRIVMLTHVDISRVM